MPIEEIRRLLADAVPIEYAKLVLLVPRHIVDAAVAEIALCPEGDLQRIRRSIIAALDRTMPDLKSGAASKEQYDGSLQDLCLLHAIDQRLS
jgi:hypothetical protein